jgi:hypothetical protein
MAMRRNFAGLDEGVRRGNGRDHQLDGSRCGILQHLRGRPIGHFDHLHGSALIQELAGDHAEAARGINGVGKLAGLRLGIGNQFRKRLHRQIGVDCNDERPAVADHGHWCVVTCRVVGQRLDHEHVGRQAGRIGEEERVAIIGRTRGRASPDNPGGAGHILHEHLLSERPRDTLAQQPCHDIGGEPRTGCHDQLDGARRPILPRLHLCGCLARDDHHNGAK